jgi:hypothetical protein
MTSVVAFRTDYFDVLQDVNAALLMSQIHYWHMADKKGKSKLRVLKNGKTWLAKSAKEWWDEVRLTPRQIDRAVTLIVKAGLVTVELFRFNGQPVRHFRCEKLESIPLVRRPHYTCRWNPIHAQVEYLTETTTETTADINTNTAQSATVKISSPKKTGGEGEKGKGGAEKNIGEEPGKIIAKTIPLVSPKNLKILHNDPEPAEVPTKIGVPCHKESNVVDLKQMMENKAKELSKVKHGMEAQWNACMVSTYELGFQKKLTMAELGQLKNIRLQTEAAKLEGLSFVRWLFEYWSSAAIDVRVAHGLLTVPDRPQIGFTLKYVGDLINVYIAFLKNEALDKMAAKMDLGVPIGKGKVVKLQSIAPPLVKPGMGGNAKTSAGIPYYKPTEQEIAEDLAYFAKKAGKV